MKQKLSVTKFNFYVCYSRYLKILNIFVAEIAIIPLKKNGVDDFAEIKSSRQGNRRHGKDTAGKSHG